MTKKFAGYSVQFVGFDKQRCLIAVADDRASAERFSDLCEDATEVVEVNAIDGDEEDADAADLI